jgi:hypothetical protein
MKKTTKAVILLLCVVMIGIGFCVGIILPPLIGLLIDIARWQTFFPFGAVGLILFLLPLREIARMHHTLKNTLILKDVLRLYLSFILFGFGFRWLTVAGFILWTHMLYY